MLSAHWDSAKRRPYVLNVAYLENIAKGNPIRASFPFASGPLHVLFTHGGELYAYESAAAASESAAAASESAANESNTEDRLWVIAADGKSHEIGRTGERKESVIIWGNYRVAVQTGESSYASGKITVHVNSGGWSTTKCADYPPIYNYVEGVGVDWDQKDEDVCATVNRPDGSTVKFCLSQYTQPIWIHRDVLVCTETDFSNIYAPVRSIVLYNCATQSMIKRYLIQHMLMDGPCARFIDDTHIRVITTKLDMIIDIDSDVVLTL